MNVVALKAKLAEIALKDETLYTKDSWAALQTVVNTANGYLENGTKAQVEEVVKALDEAVANLEIREDNVQNVITELKKLNKENYTEASYNVLANAIAKAEEDAKKGDEELDKANIEAMRKAEKELVSIVELKAALADAAACDEKNYTVSSYQALKDAAAKAEPLKADGTKEAVAAAVTEIREAIANLKDRAQGLEAYRDSIVLKTPEDYTEEAYAEYKAAYDALMALDAEETTMEMFEDAKSAFEAADAKMIPQKADYSKVEAAKAKIPADLSIYTDSSVKALKDVLAGIDYNLYRSKQKEVDAYADAIEGAIGNLVLKQQGSTVTKPAPNGGVSNGAAATGDAVNPTAMASLLLALLAIVVIMRRKMFLNLSGKDDTL